MKILHLADLHLGKKIYGYSLIEDQKYFLDYTIDFILKNNIDKVIIAGDIYDSAMPSGEALRLFDYYISLLEENKIEAFIISGNHDSNDRVGYLKNFADKLGIHINTDIKNSINPIISDGVCFYLFPYTTLFEICDKFNISAKTYDEAFKKLFDMIDFNNGMVNIGIFHQTVFPSNGVLERSESEEPSVGNVSNISSNIFSSFSYVALGHIHKMQNVGKNIRYCGSPLCYHVDEIGYKKELTVINVLDDVFYETFEFTPLRKMVKLTGSLEEIINDSNNLKYTNDYVFAALTEKSFENPMAILKNKFKNTLCISYLNNDYDDSKVIEAINDIEHISKFDLFNKLFVEKTSHELSDSQKELVMSMLGCDENEN